MEASALSAPAGLHRRSVAPLLRLRSDEQLVALFRSGSDDAFGVIHDRYRQRLLCYARQMLGGSRSDAEDVMQDVFLRAYRALRADERPVSLRAWLYRVAHNRCVDQLRRPVPAPAEVFEVSRGLAYDPLQEAERREQLRRLVADVRRLPAQQRSALLMREMDGLSYSELAAALDTSVPAVKSLLVRARIGLVEAIEARDADCADIRHDLAASYDRGVRASSRARRHLRDCTQCTSYRAQLREVRHGFAALSPSPAPTGLLAKLLGLGSAGSGAAAGGTAGGTVALGGGAAAVSVGKVAALVCCAAIVGGGAAVETTTVRHSRPAAARPAPAPVAGTATLRRAAVVRDSGPAFATRSRRSSPGHGMRAVTVTSMPTSFRGLGGQGRTAPEPSGGALAPDEPATSAPPADGSSSTTASDPLGSLLGTVSSSGSSTTPGPGSGTEGTSSASGSGSDSATAASTSTGSASGSSNTSGSPSSGTAAGSGSSGSGAGPPR